MADQFKGTAAIFGLQNLVKAIMIKNFSNMTAQQRFVVNNQGTAHGNLQ